MSLLGKNWILKHERGKGESLWSALMQSRQIQDPGTFFSSAAVSDLHDPFLFKDMQKAVQRLQSAVHARERIVVYGDYDVDGISGAALLIHTLRMLGAEVSYRIPHRRDDGYGLHKKYVEELALQKVSVLITVDLGISCVTEVQLAQSLGIDVILTDHHTVPAVLPPAFATLHPKIDDSYPFKDLSGSGMAFKLACGFLMASHNEDWIPLLTDLASLGTVADCVPLHGENRTLVKLGLEQMRHTRWEGLQALLEKSGVWEKDSFTTHTIGFQIGPRLNASGRMDDPLWALQALLATGQDAHDKSGKLDELNKSRQLETERIMQEVELALSHDSHIFVVSGKGWSSGLVGLVAGRIQEKYGKPAFVLEDQGEALTGSARSFPGFHAVDALRSVEDLLLKYGGHEQAAGFHLSKINYEAFLERLQEHARTCATQKPFAQGLEVDTHLNPGDFTPENIDKLLSFAPFGVGNPEPIFLLKDVQVYGLREVGARKEHLQFRVQAQGEDLKGIAFRAAEHSQALLEAKELLVRLKKSDWERNGVELEWVDAR